MGNEKTCKERLKQLEQQLISYHLALRDILYSSSFLKEKDDGDVINLSDINGNIIRQRTRRIFAAKYQTKKTKESHVRVRWLTNLPKKVPDVEPRFWTKKSINILYWKMVENHYSVEKSCTWQLICTRGNCNKLEKPNSLMAWNWHNRQNRGFWNPWVNRWTRYYYYNLKLSCKCNKHERLYASKKRWKNSLAWYFE